MKQTEKAPETRGKNTEKPSAARKKQTEKPAEPKKKRTASRRRKMNPKPSQRQGGSSIAYKTASRKKTGGYVIPILGCAPLTGLAYIFKYRMAGYGFLALVCLCIVGVILSYTVLGLLSVRAPAFSWWGTRILTGVLAVGIGVCLVTEAIVIKYSFGSPKEEIADCQYLLVLGAKVRNDGPSISLWDRIDGAWEVMNENPHLIAVVSGGQGPDEVKTEAQAMYENLVASGIDPDRIWMEDKASSTWENLKFSLDLIEEKTGKRPEKLAILSSEYHLFRASLFAKDQKVEFVGVPAQTSRPSQKLNHFLREVAGVWHYLILGGRYE